MSEKAIKFQSVTENVRDCKTKLKKLPREILHNQQQIFQKLNSKLIKDQIEISINVQYKIHVPINKRVVPTNW